MKSNLQVELSMALRMDKSNHDYLFTVPTAFVMVPPLEEVTTPTLQAQSTLELD